METAEKEPLDRTSIERHLQTLIVIIIVGLLGWVGTTVQETQVAVAKLTVEMEFLKIEVARPSSQIFNLEHRLDELESEVNLHINGDERHDK